MGDNRGGAWARGVSEHGLAGMQARGLMGQIATSLSRSSPPNQMLFAHPASSGLQTSANPSTVFLLTSSAPEAVAFSQGGVHSPTFLTQLTPQVLPPTPTTRLTTESITAMMCMVTMCNTLMHRMFRIR